MLGKITSFFTKKRSYYLKIKLQDKDVVFTSFGRLLALLDGQSNEVSVCTLSGDVQIVIGVK